jgi:ubiquinone/menaquinone biosynthesis C-methylase UbiE
MTPDPSRITALASLFQDSAVLFAASELGVFGALARLGPSSAPVLADALGMDPRGGSLLLDACVAVGLLLKDGGCYSNTPESAAFLVPGCPGDLSKALVYMRDVYPAWGRLADLSRTGNPVERPELHLGDDETRTRNFVLSMHGKALATARAVLDSLRLEGRRQLLDVGGGPGTYSVAISRAYPDIQATVLDLPPVIRIAEGLIAQQGAADHVTTLAGSYHATPFPPGNDVVLFFGMLHQESVAAIRSLLGKAFESMTSGGLVYVMDMMTDETHTAPKFSAMFAVNMALTTDSGWVFSSSELAQWMAEAGFTDFSVSTLPPPVPHWMAMARKP